MPETPLDVELKIQIAQEHGITVDQIDKLLDRSNRNDPLSIANRQILEQLAEMQRDITEQAEDVETYVDLTNQLRSNQEQMLQEAAKTKMFNLKKAQLPLPQFPLATPEDPFGAEQGLTGFDQEQQYGNEPQAAPGNHLEFQSEEELQNQLDAWENLKTAWETLYPLVSDEDMVSEGGVRIDPKEAARKALEGYYSTPPEDAHTREVFVQNVYPLVPHRDVQEEAGTIEAPYKPGPSSRKAEFEMYKKIIENANREIKAQAEKAARKLQGKKGFNLTKTSQQKTVDNAFLWGPNEKRFDPFYRQPVSDWHMVERNKGFGLTVDDIWNIDYEAIWRGNIMDKYSRPYRDKEGNWVGGYIQKRFEVDKWIPETNNMQLKPGQRRKPRPPEYGVLEGRLQANRAEDDRGYGPNSDTSKPFNWHEASKKPKVKTAIAFPTTTTVDGSPDRREEEIEDDLLALKKEMLQYMSPEELAVMDKEMNASLSQERTPDEEEQIQRMKEEQMKMDPDAFASQNAATKEASKKKSELKKAQLAPLEDPFRENKPGPKGIMDIKAKDRQKPQYYCSQCGNRLKSSASGGSFDPGCRCEGCSRLCIEVARLGPAKNAPDKPGPQTFDTYLQPGQRLAGLLYDSKQKKFVQAHEIKIKKKKDLVPDLKDEFVSEEFQPMQSDPSDCDCPLHGKDVELACLILCIDN